MKKRNVWITVAIIAVVGPVFYVYAGREGRIKIDTPGVRMKLRAGWFRTLRLSSTAQPVTVRARAYRPQLLSMTMEQDGDKWQIKSRGPWGKLKKIRVKNNGTTTIKPGPPILVKPRVYPRGSNVFVGLSLVGRAGEYYRAAVAKNGKVLAAPRLQIVDEKGNILASGKFEYG
ncbi:MAG: hypothetical protein ACYS76_03285 [Planctomycetota bacterium]|jgi:hypothetical protein